MVAGLRQQRPPSTGIIQGHWKGAAAAAEVCGRYAPLGSARPCDSTSVCLTHNGKGSGRSAQDILARSGAKRVLTAGGDCASDVAVIDYLHGLHPDLRVIWIDAHLDANTPETSPSGNFHGMPVSAILGRAPAQMRPFLNKPMDPAREGSRVIARLCEAPVEP
jgi:arginase